MCCQAEDYLTALQFLYNGFIRALAAKDLMRCLRLVIVRRIGGSRGGGRGPWTTPYFYPPSPQSQGPLSPQSQCLDPVLHRFGCQHD